MKKRSEYDGKKRVDKKIEYREIQMRREKGATC